MSVFDSLRRMIRGSEPTLVDYETYEATGTDGPVTPSAATSPDVIRRVGPGSSTYTGGFTAGPGGTYKMQQSYDSLLETVRELREALDGQHKRQEELLSRLSTLPAAVEALPPTSKMQNDMLKMINERLSMHAEQQRRVGEIMNALGKGKAEAGTVLEAVKEQIEMSNEIDRQLVESFNRFSMMIDRLHVANNHAVDALQQVRDSYAQTAMQMQEWIEKSRQKSGWLIGGAFFMSAAALTAVIVLIYMLSQAAGK